MRRVSSGHLSLSLLATSETDGGSWPTSVNIFDVTDIMWVHFMWTTTPENQMQLTCFVLL